MWLLAQSQVAAAMASGRGLPSECAISAKGILPYSLGQSWPIPMTISPPQRRSSAGAKKNCELSEAWTWREGARCQFHPATRTLGVPAPISGAGVLSPRGHAGKQPEAQGSAATGYPCGTWGGRSAGQLRREGGGLPAEPRSIASTAREG